MKAPRTTYRNAAHDSSRGAALLEAALLLPVLVLLLAGAYDGFRAMQAYTTLSEVAQEAVRFAARVSPLEPGSFDSLTPSSVPRGHTSVHGRIQGIISSKNWHAPLDNIRVISQLQDETGTGISGVLGPSDPSLAGIISIRVSGRYRGLFVTFLFNNLDLQITVAAPQL